MERFKVVNLRVSDAYLEQTGEEEGFVGYAYDDADPKPIKTPITEANAHTVRGTLTIGHGHTRTVKPGMKITRDEGKSLLRSDVRDAESCTHRYVRVPLTQGEFDAVTDLFFNVGPGRMKGSNGPDDPGKDGIYCLGRSGGGRQSTLLTILNSPDEKGTNYERAATCFTQWRMPGSVFEWGLLKRRIRFMLFFMGLPLTRAVNAFPSAPPMNDNARYALVQRSIALAREEQGDVEFVRGPVPAPKPDASVTIIIDKPAAIEDPLVLENIVVDKLPSQPSAELATSEVAVRETLETSAPSASPPALENPSRVDGSTVVHDSAPAKTDVAGAREGVGGPLPPVAPKIEAPAPKSSEPIGKPKDPPPVIAGQDGAKPKSPWTVQPEEVHYKLDPNAGLKPIEDSDRGKAFVWQRIFTMIIYAGGAGVFGNTFKAGSELLMKHAALMSILLDLLVPLAMSLTVVVVGAVGKSWADWRRHCAQEKASQGLY